MMRGLGARQPLAWLLSVPGGVVRLWRAASMRTGAGTGRRSGTLGRGARVDPSAVLVESDVGEGATIERDCVVVGSALGSYAKLDRHCHVMHSRLGDYSYASVGAALERTDVGRFCSIAAYVMIGATNHPMDRVTTHPFTYSPLFGGLRAEADHGADGSAAGGAVKIGPDVWIGGHAVVMPGVSIGAGAVLGAHSVVREDVAPYTVVAGVPARVIRPRFDAAVAERLLRIAWWDWDRETLRSRLADFADVPAFVAKYDRR